MQQEESKVKIKHLVDQCIYLFIENYKCDRYKYTS